VLLVGGGSLDGNRSTAEKLHVFHLRLVGRGQISGLDQVDAFSQLATNASSEEEFGQVAAIDHLLY
jgi:hypothetical protein